MIDNYEEKWIGIDEAANHLGVTKDTIRNWIKKTNIPAHKIGKLWKFKRSELDIWVKSGNIDSHNYGRNEYFNMYQLLMEEGKKDRAIKMLLQVFYLDLSGVCDHGGIRLYKEGIYTKKDLIEHYDIAIMLAPGIITRIAELKDEYNDDIIDWLYEHKLPIQVCSKQLFRKIVHSIFEGTFDEDAVNEQLKRAYTKVINSL